MKRISSFISHFCRIVAPSVIRVSIRISQLQFSILFFCSIRPTFWSHILWIFVNQRDTLFYAVFILTRSEINFPANMLSHYTVACGSVMRELPSFNQQVARLEYAIELLPIHISSIMF